jgi:hypothetical protein
MAGSAIASKNVTSIDSWEPFGRTELSENVETYGVGIVPKSLFPGLQFIETRRFAGGRNVSRIGVLKFWNPQYDLFEIGRSYLGNPRIVVGSEARFLLQGMNLALHLRHLVV